MGRHLIRSNGRKTERLVDGKESHQVGIDKALGLSDLAPRPEFGSKTAEDGIVRRASKPEAFVVDVRFPVGLAGEPILAEASHFGRTEGPIQLERKKTLHRVLKRGMLNKMGREGAAKSIIQVPAVCLDEIDIGNDQPVKIPVVDTPDDRLLLLGREIRVTQAEVAGAEGRTVKAETTPVVPLVLRRVEETADSALATVEKADELAVVDYWKQLGPAILPRSVLASITPTGGGVDRARGAETRAVLAEKTLQPRATAVAVVVETAAGGAGFLVVRLAQVVGEDHVSTSCPKVRLAAD